MTRSDTAFSALCLVLLALLAVWGCGRDENPTAPALGEIRINAQPVGEPFEWSLQRGGAVDAVGAGDTVLAGRSAGSYRLTWQPRPNWSLPDTNPAVGDLPAGGRLVLRGSYSPLPGSIVIDPAPDLLAAAWRLNGPDGFFRQGQGDRAFSDLNTGTYTLTWRDMPGWTTPEPAVIREDLGPGGALVFQAEYVEGSGTVRIEVGPNYLPTRWGLLGPESLNLTGRGDTLLTDAAPGQYYITWAPVAGWNAPVSWSDTLRGGQTLVLTGLYEPGTPLPTGFGWLPAAGFDRGSPAFETGRYDDETPGEVALSRPLLMMTAEMTNGRFVQLADWALQQGLITATAAGLFDALDGSTVQLMDLTDPDCRLVFDGGGFSTDAPDLPVVEINWFGAAACCDWSSLLLGLPKAYDHVTWICNGGEPYLAAGFRLPTEAEWELACRASTNTAFAGGVALQTACGPEPSLDPLGWYCGNRGGGPSPVATRQVNDWDFHDLHGNVWEWCNDWYVPYPSGPVVDPTGPLGGSLRVARGGSWFSEARDCRSARRGRFEPGLGAGTIGFRLVRPVP